MDNSIIDDDGNIFWCQDGLLHRDDGPAIEWINGDKYWYKNGKLHRIDGPAVEWTDGSGEYWINNNYYDSLEEGLMNEALK